MREPHVPVHEDPRVHEFLGAAAARQVAILNEWGLAPTVALILVNACENRCFFCASPGTTEVAPADVTGWDRIRAHLDGRPADVERLVIAGNEPVLHPAFERALAHAHALGFRDVQLMTSGLRLDDASLARWVGWGLASVAVPIYAAEARLHDAVCGTPCFDRLVQGLDAAHRAGLRLHLHTLALRRTVDGLPALARFVQDRWGATLAVAPLREKPLFVWDDETVPLDEIDELLSGLEVSRLGLPTCIGRGLPRAEALVVDVYFRTQRRGYATACEGCADRVGCPGVVAAELERRGGRGLRPR